MAATKAAVAPVRLHVADRGSGPVIVWLHGLGASLDDWDGQLAFFAKDFRCIAPDLRGFGASPRPGGYTVPRFAADVWALLDAEGIEHVYLVGHSMGGAVAQQMAIEQPQRVLRLVLADTLPSFQANTFGKRLLFATRYATMGILGPKRLSRAIALKLFPNADQAELRERVRIRGEANDRGVYLQTIRGLLAWSVVDRLDRLRMPVLVLVAQHDYFPVADAEHFAAALPDARLKVFAGAHHALPLEAPTAFNAVVAAFLASKPVKAAKRPRRARTSRAKDVSAAPPLDG